MSIRKALKTTWLLSALLLLSACEAESVAPDITDSELRQLVQARYVQPFREGDIDRWMTIFHRDAIAMHNHRPADNGRDSIENFGRMVHELLTLDRYDVRVTDIRASGDWAYTTGVFDSRFLLKATGQEAWPADSGKFVLVWERQADGEWLIVLDMGNTSLPR